MLLSLPTITGQFVTFGFSALASLTAKLMVYGVQSRSTNGSWNLESPQTWNTPTSFQADTLTAIIGYPLIWIRYQDDGTNIKFFVSADGVAWQQVSSVTKAASWLGTGNFNYFGIVLNPQGQGTTFTVMSFAITFP